MVFLLFKVEDGQNIYTCLLMHYVSVAFLIYKNKFVVSPLSSSSKLESLFVSIPRPPVLWGQQGKTYLFIIDIYNLY